MLEVRTRILFQAGCVKRPEFYKKQMQDFTVISEA